MIIDAHAHLGIDRVFDEVRDEEEIIRTMNNNGVDATILQYMFGHIEMDEIREGHDRIYALAQKQKNRIYGMITMTPYLRENQFYDEARRCVQQLGFVGMKMHPMAMAVSPVSKAGEFMWKVCDDLGIPIMVHTGAGIPLALPSLCITMAKKYPRVPCILGHCGMITLWAEAYLAASSCENIYLETSWTALHHIKEMVRVFGAKRMMFGGDESTNVPVELSKYSVMDILEQDKEWCLWKTANIVFHLGIKPSKNRIETQK